MVLNKSQRIFPIRKDSPIEFSCVACAGGGGVSRWQASPSCESRWPSCRRVFRVPFARGAVLLLLPACLPLRSWAFVVALLLLPQAGALASAAWFEKLRSRGPKRPCGKECAGRGPGLPDRSGSGAESFDWLLPGWFAAGSSKRRGASEWEGGCFPVGASSALNRPSGARRLFLNPSPAGAAAVRQ